MNTTPHRQSAESDHVWISQPDGASNVCSDPDGRFTIVDKEQFDPRRYLQMDTYSAAMAFVRGKIDVRGDICEAIRYFSRQPHSAPRQLFFSALARLQHLRTSLLLGNKDQAARSIQFHYDRSNEFYSQFLDSRMIYSAAHFGDPEDSLESAQRQKLDTICRDLVLCANDRFLDIGCGWGGLVTYAAKHFGVTALGCTVAQQQWIFAQRVIEQDAPRERVSVRLCDYRDLDGSFDKIASVGMFEHVGRARLSGYFRKAFQLLNPGGLFLNRGVVRPQGVSDGPDTLFIQRSVFPGGELVHLDDVVREGERAGFDVVGIRNLFRHYALTCQAWVKNLQRNAAHCRDLVGPAAYRTWLLYLAASAVGFEDGRIGAAQVLFRKRRSSSEYCSGRV
jgi:cyclopropane-fatty-acyl-phospholipid synthase